MTNIKSKFSDMNIVASTLTDKKQQTDYKFKYVAEYVNQWAIISSERDEITDITLGKDKNIDPQIENKFNAFKAYAAKHDLHWGFVRDKDNRLYINNTEFAIDMADDHWKPINQVF